MGWSKTTEFVVDFVRSAGVAGEQRSFHPPSVFFSYHLHSKLAYFVSIAQTNYVFHSSNFQASFLTDSVAPSADRESWRLVSFWLLVLF